MLRRTALQRKTPLRSKSPLAKAPKPKSPKMKVRDTRREFPVHRAYVKSFGCAIRGCFAAPTDFAHLRTAANSGTGLKPRDEFGVFMCHEHHRESHQRGHRTVAEANGMTLDDLFAKAAHYAATTPDRALRKRLEAERSMEHLAFR